MFAAAMRAWYLPTCVKSDLPVTSPMPQTFSPAQTRSSTLSPLRSIVTGSFSSPKPSTFGRRPTARRSCAPSISPAPSPVQRRRTRPPPASTAVGRVDVRTSIPSASNASPSSAPASGSIRSRSVAPLFTIVTFEPMRA